MLGGSQFRTIPIIGTDRLRKGSNMYSSGRIKDSYIRLEPLKGIEDELEEYVKNKRKRDHISVDYDSKGDLNSNEYSKKRDFTPESYKQKREFSTERYKKSRDFSPESPTSSAFEDQTPILGYTSRQESKVWSELPTSSVAQTSDYSQTWSNPVVDFIQKEELNKAIGFWMNVKKTAEPPRYPYVSLQDSIGNSEVLTKPQTPTTPISPMSATDSEIMIETNKESIAASLMKATIPMDIEQSLRKFFPSLTDTHGSRTPPPSATSNTREAPAVKKTTQLKRSCVPCKKSPRPALRQKRHHVPSATPPRSPTATGTATTTHRDNRVKKNRSRSSWRPTAISRRVPPLLSRTSHHTSRRRISPLHRRISRPPTQIARHHPTRPLTALRNAVLSQLALHRLPELSRFSLRSCASYRPPPHRPRLNSPLSNRNNSMRSITPFAATSRSPSPTEPQSRYGRPVTRKKKKKSLPRTPIVRQRASQPPKVFPILEFSRSKNVCQQTDQNLTSTSIQTNPLPPPVIELIMEDSLKSSAVTKSDLASQATQTILTSQPSSANTVGTIGSRDSDSMRLKPLLMSRTAQTTPCTDNSLVTTPSQLTGLSTDSDISGLDSQNSMKKPIRRFSKRIRRPVYIKSKLSETSAVSSVMSDAKRICARKTVCSKCSNYSQSYLSDASSKSNPMNYKKSSSSLMNGKEVRDNAENRKLAMRMRRMEIHESLMRCNRPIAAKETSTDPFKVCDMNSEELSSAIKGAIGVLKNVSSFPKQHRGLNKRSNDSKMTSVTQSVVDASVLASQTSQIAVSSLPTDKDTTADDVSYTEVTDKPNTKSSVKNKPSEEQNVVKFKEIQKISKEKFVSRKETSKSLIKYASTSQSTYHFVKNKSLSSAELKNVLKRNRLNRTNTNSSINNNKSKTKSERDLEERDVVVKNNLNMLVRACQNLLSEALKDSHSLKRNVSAGCLGNKKTANSQDTIAWILQSLRSSYENQESNLSNEDANTFLAVKEQESQTSAKKRNSAESIAEVKDDPSKELKQKEKDMKSLSQTSMAPAATSPPSQLNNLQINHDSEDISMKCTQKLPETVSGDNPPSAPKTHLEESAEGTLLAGDSVEKGVLKLNCGKYKIALRQVSGKKHSDTHEPHSDENSRTYTIGETAKPPLSDPENSQFKLLTTPIVNTALNTSRGDMSKIAEVVHPVTKVSIWSKSVSDRDSTTAATSMEHDALKDIDCSHTREELFATDKSTTSSNKSLNETYDSTRIESQSENSKSRFSLSLEQDASVILQTTFSRRMTESST